MRSFTTIVFYLFCISFRLHAVNELRFHHITLEDGLSNSHVYCMIQDKKGYIWIGTQDGLNRYDGYTFVTYYSNPFDQKSINDNTVFSLYCDNDTVIWIGTFSGFNSFNPTTGVFRTITFGNIGKTPHIFSVNQIMKDKRNDIWLATEGQGIIRYNPVSGKYKIFNALAVKKQKASINIKTIWQDRDGYIWVGTEGDGFYVLDTLNGNYNQIINEESNTALHGNEEIMSLYADTENNLWITTRNLGLYSFNLLTKKFSHFQHDPKNNQSIGGNEVYSVLEDKKGNLWVGVNDGGLNLFNRKTGTFKRYVHNVNDNQGLLNNKIRYIFEDNQQNLWVLSFQKGLNIQHSCYSLFNYYSLNENNEYKYESNTVLSVAMDDQKNLWVGTDGGGLKYIDRNQQELMSYLPDASGGSKHQIPDKVVLSVYVDHNHKLWLGTFVGGLANFDPVTKKWKVYQHNPDDLFSLSDNFVSNILEDRMGNIWISTNGGGVNKLNPATGKFQRYRSGSNSQELAIISDYSNCLMLDRNDRIWIGTYYGFSILDEKSSSVKSFQRFKQDTTQLSHNTVYCILEDSKGRYWIGTQNGLNLFDEKKEIFKVFTIENGLPNNTIYSMQEDNEGHIWVSTNKGLSRFDFETKTFKNYFIGDGLQSNEFFRGSSYKGFNGELFFGGINGLNSFFPVDFNLSDDFSDVVITGFKIFNEDIPVGKKIKGQVILPKNISYLNEIELDYNLKSFSFEFSAMNFTLPQKINYMFKMEGFDQEWKTVSSSYRYVTYTNLDPGEYHFQIKASNINNNWGDAYTSLRVTINPPIWLTWQAKIMYILFFIALAFVIFYIIKSRIVFKNEQRREKMMHEKTDAINQAKLRFFTNISHEFRTPLTLILGPLEQVIKNKNIDGKSLSKLEIVMKNARRMLRLVNQLLDMRKIDGEKMTLQAEKGDIIVFLKNIVYSFEEYALQKKIQLTFDSPFPHLEIWFDPDKVDKIFFNLLSNAFKFTPPKGMISVRVSKIKNKIHEKENTEYIQFEISDTGTGIEKRQLDKIFDRFYQANEHINESKGSGLGLNLTKSFVDIHHGIITVESVAGIGTTFKVMLPNDENLLSDKEKIISNGPMKNKYIHNIPVIESVTPERHPDIKDKKGESILVVEDSYDLRNYLVDELSVQYNIYSASNGKEAREVVFDVLPDLVISDIMMPEEDGLTFCTSLKSNIVTCHIPIILLTAKIEPVHQVEGLETGADAYIIKPFDLSYLMAQVKQLLDNRRRLKEKYGNLFNPEEAEKPLNVKDKLIEKVTSYIMANLQDPSLNVEKLSQNIGISRGHLHRKMKNAIEMGPNEYIKIIRLKESVKLLLGKEYNISEISYMTGFNNPAYFTKCFKDQYQISPSEFVAKNT